MKQFILMGLLLALAGCTSIERYVHMQQSDAVNPKVFNYKDHGKSIYYSFSNGNDKKHDIFIFFYGGSGCTSWKSVMPDYAKGLPKNAMIYVLNKRFVKDKDLGMFSCTKKFHAKNYPAQWLSDYQEFIKSKWKEARIKPKYIVLVGVSEGVNLAVKVATLQKKVTHLVLLGGGGYTMRKSLKVLEEKGDIPFTINVDKGIEKIKNNPNSLEETWFGNPYFWWSRILDYNPIPDYLSLDIPILLAIGEKDSSVPLESAEYLESVFKKAGKTNLVVYKYKNANHRLDAGGHNYREEFFSHLLTVILSR